MENSILETGCFHLQVKGREMPTLLGPLERANCCFQNVMFSIYLEFQMTFNVQKSNGSECYTQSSELFRFWVNAAVLSPKYRTDPIIILFNRSFEKCGTVQIFRYYCNRLKFEKQYFFAACVACWLLLTLFLAHRFLSFWWWRQYAPLNRQILQESHDVTSQKTAFFIVIALITSNLSN
jgi:hypothetical protein